MPFNYLQFDMSNSCCKNVDDCQDVTGNFDWSKIVNKIIQYCRLVLGLNSSHSVEQTASVLRFRSHDWSCD